MKILFKHEIKSSDNFSIEKIVIQILKNRQIDNVDGFLNPPHPEKYNLTDFGISQSSIDKALKILEKIKKENKMIVVYTDYDADGITGGAILWETLHLLGFKAMPYVPHRRHEGYGFSIKGIDNVIKQFNPALIISVDHGITKIKEVDYAKKKGIPVIITDHHLKNEKTPKSFATFHIPALSGAGVSFFFSKMIFENFKLNTNHNSLITNYFENDFLSLATIGIVADLIPLVNQARSVVFHGLKTFTKIKKPGLKHILHEAGLSNKPITPYEIGYMIAPRINAVGRLEHALSALRLLCTNDEEKAEILARQAGHTNRERQDLVEKSVEEAENKLHSSLSTLNSLPSRQAGPFSKLIILVSDIWHEGIIGLIASKITDKYYRPTLVLTKSNDVYKGSARSIPGFHITNFLRSLKDNLIDVGGHPVAAGFTIEKKQIKEFIKQAEKKANEIIDDKMLERKTEVDLKIPLSKVNLKLAQALEKLQPFGIGNPQPKFLSCGKIIDVKTFGKKQEYLKIYLQDPENPKSEILEFLNFNSTDKPLSLSRNETIDVVYKLDINRWGGREVLRGIIYKYRDNALLFVK